MAQMNEKLRLIILFLILIHAATAKRLFYGHSLQLKNDGAGETQEKEAAATWRQLHEVATTSLRFKEEDAATSLRLKDDAATSLRFKDDGGATSLRLKEDAANSLRFKDDGATSLRFSEDAAATSLRLTDTATSLHLNKEAATTSMQKDAEATSLQDAAPTSLQNAAPTSLQDAAATSLQLNTEDAAAPTSLQSSKIDDVSTQRNKTISELVQEQTDAIKKIIAQHKSAQNVISLASVNGPSKSPVYTPMPVNDASVLPTQHNFNETNEEKRRKTAVDAQLEASKQEIANQRKPSPEDAAKIKQEKESQFIEELRMKCQHFFKGLTGGLTGGLAGGLTDVAPATTEKVMNTVQPFGPAAKPHFFKNNDRKGGSDGGGFFYIFQTAPSKNYAASYAPAHKNDQLDDVSMDDRVDSLEMAGSEDDVTVTEVPGSSDEAQAAASSGGERKPSSGSSMHSSSDASTHSSSDASMQPSSGTPIQPSVSLQEVMDQLSNTPLQMSNLQLAAPSKQSAAEYAHFTAPSAQNTVLKTEGQSAAPSTQSAATLHSAAPSVQETLQHNAAHSGMNKVQSSGLQTIFYPLPAAYLKPAPSGAQAQLSAPQLGVQTSAPSMHSYLHPARPSTIQTEKNKVAPILLGAPIPLMQPADQLKFKYAKLEPLVLQKTLLPSGKSLLSWYRLVPNTQSFVKIPDTPETAEITLIAQPQNRPAPDTPLPEHYGYYMDPGSGAVLKNVRKRVGAPVFFVGTQNGLMYQAGNPQQLIFHKGGGAYDESIYGNSQQGLNEHVSSSSLYDSQSLNRRKAPVKYLYYVGNHQYVPNNDRRPADGFTYYVGGGGLQQSHFVANDLRIPISSQYYQGNNQQGSGDSQQANGGSAYHHSDGQQANGDNVHHHSDSQQANGVGAHHHSDVQQANGGGAHHHSGSQQANGGSQQTNGGFLHHHGDNQQAHAVNQDNQQIVEVELSPFIPPASASSSSSSSSSAHSSSSHSSSSYSSRPSTQTGSSSSSSSSHFDSVPTIQVVSDDVGPPGPQVDVDYAQAGTERPEVYRHEFRFVVPVGGLADRLARPQGGGVAKFPYELDPFAYLPAENRPGLMNIAVPYVPNYHVIKTLAVPNEVMTTNDRSDKMKEDVENE